MKTEKLKEIYFANLPKLMEDFTIDNYNQFEKDIIENAKTLGFDMDIFI